MIKKKNYTQTSIFILLIFSLFKNIYAISETNKILYKLNKAIPYEMAKQKLSIIEKYNSPINKNINVMTELGKTIPLKNIFQSKPIILIPFSTTCRSYCSFYLKFIKSQIVFENLLKDYNIILYNINNNITNDALFLFKQNWYQDLPRPIQTQINKSVFFIRIPDNKKLLVEKKNTQHNKISKENKSLLKKPLLDYEKFNHSLGYKILRINNDKIVHQNVFIFLSPNGNIKRYIYGLSKIDFKLARIENKVKKSLLDQYILKLFQYNQKEKSFQMNLSILLITGISIIILCMGIYFFFNEIIFTKKEKTI